MIYRLYIHLWKNPVDNLPYTISLQLSQCLNVVMNQKGQEHADKKNPTNIGPGITESHEEV
jgi:hypothetical protein